MIDLLILVVLVAWFFGISYGAAVHGIIGFFFILVGIGFVLLVLDSVHESYVNRPAQKPAPAPIPKRTPKRRQPTVAGTIAKWIVGFVVSYVITLLFMACISEFIRIPSLGWFEFAVPTIPFVIFTASRIVRKMIQGKRAH